MRLKCCQLSTRHHQNLLNCHRQKTTGSLSRERAGRREFVSVGDFVTAVHSVDSTVIKSVGEREGDWRWMSFAIKSVIYNRIAKINCFNWDNQIGIFHLHSSAFDTMQIFCGVVHWRQQRVVDRFIWINCGFSFDKFSSSEYTSYNTMKQYMGLVEDTSRFYSTFLIRFSLEKCIFSKRYPFANVPCILGSILPFGFNFRNINEIFLWSSFAKGLDTLGKAPSIGNNSLF